MATDQDRYGSKLGRGFRRVWAEVCAAADDGRGAAELAQYVFMRLKQRDSELPRFYANCRRLVEASSASLFGGKLLDIASFEISACATLPRIQVYESFRDALDMGSKADAIELFSERALGTVRAALHVQPEYAQDDKGLSEFDKLSPKARQHLVARLRSWLLKQPAVGIMRLSEQPQSDILRMPLSVRL